MRNDRRACLARGGEAGEMNAACGKNEPTAATMPERGFGLGIVAEILQGRLEWIARPEREAFMATLLHNAKYS